MKLVFVLTCFLASTAASVISGWEQLKSPLFNPRYESILSEIYSQVNGDQGSSRTPRIVGGKDAARNQFPFQTYLYFDRVSSCGGSIISPNFILTVSESLSEFEKKLNFHHIVTGRTLHISYRLCRHFCWKHRQNKFCALASCFIEWIFPESTLQRQYIS